MAKPLIQTTGRRKESVARVRFSDGSGQVTLNGKPLEAYFSTMATRMRVMEPLSMTQTQGRSDIGPQARPKRSASESPGLSPSSTPSCARL
jgi:small subunit ribosomal protein S9